MSSCWQKGFRWKSVYCRVPGISIIFGVHHLSFGSLSKDAVRDTRWVSPVTARSSTTVYTGTTGRIDDLVVIYWWLKITQIVRHPIWYVRTRAHTQIDTGTTIFPSCPPHPLLTSFHITPHTQISFTYHRRCMNVIWTTHSVVMQSHYFIWQISFVASRRYSAGLAGGQLSRLRQYDKLADRKWRTIFAI